MEEKQETVTSGAQTPQPHHNLRESLLRRVTPHFLPHGAQTSSVRAISPMPGDMPAAPAPAARPGLLDRLSSYREAHKHHTQANTNYQEEPLTSQEDKLTDFRRLVGIDNSASHTTSGNYHRAAENIGIYKHVVDAEKACLAKYKRFSLLINMSLGMQLIFSAALTALGAGDGPKSAVTAFGAINTVLAGVLTFLKGSGLPNREKYYAGEWSKLRDHIEQREREFGRVGCPYDVDMEMRQIESMFHEVKQDVEANTPDGFTSVTTKRLVGAFGGQQGPRTPGNVEAGMANYPHRAASLVASSAATQHLTATPNIMDKLNAQISSHVDPSSRAGKALSQLQSLQSKYGDSILEKLHHLDKHEDIDKASTQLGSSTRDMSANLERSLSSGTQAAHAQINSATNMVNAEAAQLAEAGVHAQVAGETAARELAEHTAAAGRQAFGGVQSEAGRVAEQAQHEADRLRDVGRQAESTARSISSHITGDLRSFLSRGHGDGERR